LREEGISSQNRERSLKREVSDLSSEFDRQRAEYSKKLSDERYKIEHLERECTDLKSELERKKLELVTLMSERDRVIN
jgi:hypothetical protein